MRGRGSQRPPRSPRAERTRPRERGRQPPPARPRWVPAVSLSSGAEPPRGLSSACGGFPRTAWTALAPEEPGASLGPHRPPAAAWASRLGRASHPEPRAGRGLHIRPHPPEDSPPRSPAPSRPGRLPPPTPPSVPLIFSRSPGLALSDIALKEMHPGKPHLVWRRGRVWDLRVHILLFKRLG